MLIIAGQPLNEPIAQYGPFVMNTAEQIQETLRDYQSGKFAAAVGSIPAKRRPCYVLVVVETLGFLRTR